VAGEKKDEAGGRERPGGEAPGGETGREERARGDEADADVAQREEEAKAGRLGGGGEERGQCEPPETQAEWQALWQAETGAGRITFTEPPEDAARDIALHIAALSPQYVRREEIPPETLEKEKDIERVKLREQKKPEAMIEKILTGKIEKYFETVCLVDQPFVKDDKKKVHEVVTEAVAKIGENISIRRFTRYQVGEGIEKKKEDLATEVAKTLGQ